MIEVESRRRALSAEQVLLAYEALLARSARPVFPRSPVLFSD